MPMTNETPPENPEDYPEVGLAPAPPADAAIEGPHAPDPGQDFAQDFDATPVMPQSTMAAAAPLEGAIIGDYTAQVEEVGEYGGRIAPCNIEAEQAVLGALLLQNEAYFRLSAFLKPEHFYEPLHARLYSITQYAIRHIYPPLADAIRKHADT